MFLLSNPHSRCSARIHPRNFGRFIAAGFALSFAVLLASARPAHADSWALLIGIDQYDDTNHITSLGGAAADARALAQTLEEVAGVPAAHVKLLVSDGELHPTRANILEALTRLKANAKPGDTVFVVYSGHGIEINGTPYLLPFDTKATSDEDITDTALETAKFTQRLREIKARAVVMAFDMCRSDPRKEKKAVGSDSDNKLTQSQVRGLDFSQPVSTASASSTPALAAPISVTLYSCSPDERSYEDRLASRGFFSEYLEKGLRGAAADNSGAVRVSSLVKYLTTTVHAAVEQAESASQTPYPETKGPNVEDFVLVHTAVAATTPVASAARPVVSAVDTHARLTFKVNVPNPTITVDGQAVNASAAYVTNLLTEAKRTVKVSVTAPGYDGQVVSAELLPGATTPVEITLIAVSPPPVAHSPTPPATPMIAAGSVKINPKDGAEMVYVPAGPFLMGDDEFTFNPRRTVTLASFYIYKNMVTVAMYRKYCAATGKAMPEPPLWGWRDDHPMVNVTWDEAKAYCVWAGGALPSEAQWEKAARGTDGRKYPWGDEWDRSNLWCSDKRADDANSTHSVGGFPAGASPYGALDMAGNAFEWCEDWTSHGAQGTDPQIGTTVEYRVLKGGAYNHTNPVYFLSANRLRNPPTLRDRLNGFRPVVAATGLH